MNLLKYQQENLSSLKKALEQYNNIVVVGPACSGRNTVIEKAIEKNDVIIGIYPSNYHEKCADILYAIRNTEAIKDERRFVKIGLELQFISMNIESESLFPIEQKVLRFLKKLSRQKNIFFVINNIDNIDCGTLDIIDKLCNGKKRFFRKKTVKIIVSETNLPNTYYHIKFKGLQCNKKLYAELLKELGLKSSISLSQDILEFIFKNANGNIRTLNRIVNDFNTNAIDTELNTQDKNATINNLIATTIESTEYSKKLHDILNIIAISDTYFNSSDLSFLLQNESNLIELYLEYAVKYKLLENENSFYKIIFGIIEKIYSRVNVEKKLEIYNAIVDLMANHYPDLYEEKYKFAKLANYKNASNFYVQSILKLIRENMFIASDLEHTNLSTQEKDIILRYNDAWCKSNNNLYNDAVKIIEATLSEYPINSPIRQELYLLKSQALIKSINSFDRNEAINLLNYDHSDHNIDEYLKYRLDTRKIAALIHNGRYKDARNQSDYLINRIITFIKETNSPGMLYYLNVIYRKYCNTHSYESSIGNINKSIDFFSKNKKYIKDTYIALNNAFALNLINGDEVKAQKNMQQITKIKEENFYYKFPRNEIFDNNKLVFELIYDFEEKKEYVLKKFEALYESTMHRADNILIASNYSIVLALNNHLELAVDVLKKYYNEFGMNPDMEGIYRYRIISNYSICLFLQDNSKRQEALSLLGSIHLSEDDLHNKDRSKELYYIIKTMEHIESCRNAIDWIKAYQNNIDTPRNYYRLYEYGFVFTTLFDWDDE